MEFLSPDQIIEQLFQDLLQNPGDLEHFVGTKPEKLISLHHGYGRWIRNHFNLWNENNPHTMKDYQPVIIDGCDANEKHPDSVSMRIIEQLHTKCVEYYKAVIDIPKFS